MLGLVTGQGQHRVLKDHPCLAGPVVGSSPDRSGPVAVRFGGVKVHVDQGCLHQSPQRRRLTSLVPEDVEVVEGLLEPLPGLGRLPHDQLAGRVASPRPVQQDRPVVAVEGERQHVSEARVPARLGWARIWPEQVQRLHEAQSATGITPLHRPAPCRVEVGVLRLQRVVSVRLELGDGLISPRFGEADEVVEVPSANCVFTVVAIGPQSGQRVAPDKLMHREPTTRGRLAEDQTALDQNGECAEIGLGNRLGCLRGEAAGEHSERSEDTLLAGGQQGHRRVQNGRHIPMPGLHGEGGGAQPLRLGRQELSRRLDVRPGREQLDRQR